MQEGSVIRPTSNQDIEGCGHERSSWRTIDFIAGSSQTTHVLLSGIYQPYPNLIVLVHGPRPGFWALFWCLLPALGGPVQLFFPSGDPSVRWSDRSRTHGARMDQDRREVVEVVFPFPGRCKMVQHQVIPSNTPFPRPPLWITMEAGGGRFRAAVWSSSWDSSPANTPWEFWGWMETN